MRKRELSSRCLKNQITLFMSKNTLTNSNVNDIDSLKAQLIEVNEIEQQELCIRAGIKWREEGERSTAYFFEKL